MKKAFAVVLLFFFLLPVSYAYQQRFMNFGMTSFVDGLPLPAGKGFYLYEHWTRFNAHAFKDTNGDDIPGTQIKNQAILTQLIYQSDLSVIRGKLGTDLMAIYVNEIKLPPNPGGLTTSGTGFDDLLWGVFLQWNPITLDGGRPLMANRVEMAVYFPTGKFDEQDTINPGAHHYSLEPYWAATVFILPRWTVSWRLHYLINYENHRSHITAGNAYHINFATSVEVIPKRLRIGIAGYYLRQTANSKINGVIIPNSEERVLGMGPGFLASITKDVHIFFNAYFEDHVQNRPKGTRVVVGLLAHL